MTIDCRDMEEAAADLLGEEGSPELASAIAQHTAGCARCAGALEGLPTLLANLRSLEVPEPGPAYWGAFVPALRARLADSSPWSSKQDARSSIGWLRPALALAATVAVALLATAPPASRAIPPPPAELTTAELGAMHALSSLFDAIAVDESFPLEELADGSILQGEPSLSAESGQLFEFFAITESLSLAEERALLTQLRQDFQG